MDFGPDLIMITPSYMLTLLDEFRRQGIDPRSSSLRIGLFGAEPWGEGVRRRSSPLFDSGGVRHLWALRGDGNRRRTGACGTRRGPPVREDHFLPEIADSAKR